jgi:3-hydroxyacyl-CoA dehydrogenase
MSVQFEKRDAVAVAIVDRPPVNAIDSSVRAGLLAAVKQAEADSSIRALVVACRGRTFMSGADLSELGSEIKPPSYPETLAALENCPIPVIAALHGTALGGGLEIAMACHYRCAAREARMGMPEITLGILPGAGGTQRLPRLVGGEQALELLLKGAPITAQSALEMGLIDEVFDGDALAGGIAMARKLIAAQAKARPTRSLPVRGNSLDAAAIEAILQRHARALKGRTTQNVIVESIRAASGPFDDGLRLEAKLSAESLLTTESRALRHVFFAERECGRIPGLASSDKAPEISRAAVIGAGTMGSGIAMALADAGIPTALIERDSPALERGLKIIRDNYDVSLKRGRIDAETVQSRVALIQGFIDPGKAADADLVIEAVFEDFELKRSVLRNLDEIIAPTALLASNTSSLSLTALAADTKHPQRVVGLHFFSPANVMRLLEIVRGQHTSDATLVAALALAKKLRKIGVVSGDGFGFIGNRMMLDGYFREAELMLLQGIAPARIDAVMENFGFAMGPNRVNDMAGIDVGTRVRTELARRESRAAPYHAVSDALTAQGKLGQKSGRGIYLYEPGDRTARPNPELEPLVRDLAARHGIAPRDASDEEIEQRCVLSLAVVGARILEEGIAFRASDIDVVWTSGYGFPRWRGGPMCYADSLGLAAVVKRVEELQSTGGGDYWAIPKLLRELAASGRTFADWDRERRS